MSIVDAMDEGKFALMKPLLDEMSSHGSCTGMSFRYITLGADKSAEGFYEKCGFHEIFEIHGQKIYQRMLN